MQSEYRAAPRRDVAPGTDVVDTMTGHTVAQLHDLSSNGLRMSGSQLLKLEALYQLRFRLDEVHGDDGKLGSAIECAAQVLWVRADGVTGLYITGLRIILMNTQVVGSIDAWAKCNPQREQ
ncbi:PilZ domain-containing protein [Lysobacter soyae]|nr:PilZ domain-containing protein [Lysobacter sp. CJ11]